MFNTLPYNSFPASTAKFEEGKNDEIQAEIDAIKDGTNIDSFGDVETALSLKANSTDMETALSTKTNLSNIAPIFDAESGIYDIGDQVIYEGVLYEFTSAHDTPSEWDSSEVQAVKVSELIDTLKSGLTNVTRDVTSEFTLTVSTLEDVFFTVEDDPVSRTITIHITGNSSVGFPNGGITITAPSKYRHNIPNGVIFGAGGMARTFDDIYAFVVAVTSSDGVGLIVNYSQAITAVNLSFTCSYRYVTN